MKKISFLLLLMVCINLSAQKLSINIIPQPVKIEQNTGFYVLTKSTFIGFNNPIVQKTAELFAQKLNIPTGFSIQAKQSKNSPIQLNLNLVQNLVLGNEGYTLEVNSNGIIIAANKQAGLYYGIQTLLQLLPNEIESKKIIQTKWIIPAVKITDYPRFAWRGVMLDVSRNFFTKEEVKSYIDQISRYKFNTFHWHLTDDNGWRIEIKSLPKLTEVGAWRVKRYGQFGERENPKPNEPATDGGFYTQEDIKEIIEYANDRYITIVPEIDVPGHSMAAIASYPELCCTKDTSIKVNPGTNFAEWYGNGKFKMLIDNTLNPSDEKVYQFLDKVFTEIAALFPNPYIHVGGDECYKGYWETNSECQALMKKNNYHNIEQLQGYFMNRLELILKEKGKKLLGWDEILEGGISPDATLMSWRGTTYSVEATKLKHDVVMAPTAFCYLDYSQGDPTIEPPIYSNLRISKSYSFEPIAEGADAHYILGGQGNLWTEQVATLRHAQYMIYPRAWALSEVYWSQKENKNWANFCNRMENHFVRSDFAQVNYSKAVYDAIISTKKENGILVLNLATEMPGLDIYYTIDGSMPDKYSPKYATEVKLPIGPITLRVITYRDGKPLGHLITLNRDDLEKR